MDNTIMNRVIFSAHVTEEVPPRITLASHDVPLQKDGVICTNLIVKAGRQITVQVGNKTLINEAAEDLASAHDCGKRTALHQVGQNTYAYTDDFEDARVGNLSQVTLQVRGANLVVRFTQGEAGPVVPVPPIGRG